jgi:hypothetical protein
MNIVGSIGRAVLARLALFAIVVSLVWVAFVWLYAYHPDTLGWCYAKLRPVTIAFYQLVDTRLPDAIKYKVSAGLSDELGPRALFLLILGGLIEVVVLGMYRAVMALVRGTRSTP